jgi:hypothetical protein
MTQPEPLTPGGAPDHDADDPSGSAGRRRLVRPRRVWVGTLVALVGCIVIAVGVILTSWPWTVVGGVVLLAGGVVAYRGGVMYDARSGGLRPELTGLVRGRERRGVAPGDMVTAPRAVETSRRVDRRRRRLERAAASAPRRIPVRPTGGVLVLVAMFLLVSQWELYPLELPGQTNATRALGCAIVVGLSGMRVLEAGAGRSHTAPALATLASGGLLILNGAVADHARTATAAVEVACGVVCVVCAGALTVRSRERQEAWAGHTALVPGRGQQPPGGPRRRA